MSLGRRPALRRFRAKVTIRDRNRGHQWTPHCAIKPAGPAILDGMAEDLRVNNWLVIPASELRERFSRSSGPGGQSVNTTDSRVELSFDILRSPSLPERERDRATARLASRLADGVITVAAEASGAS